MDEPLQSVQGEWSWMCSRVRLAEVNTAGVTPPTPSHRPTCTDDFSCRRGSQLSNNTHPHAKWGSVCWFLLYLRKWSAKRVHTHTDTHTLMYFYLVPKEDKMLWSLWRQIHEREACVGVWVWGWGGGGVDVCVWFLKLIQSEDIWQ